MDESNNQRPTTNAQVGDSLLSCWALDVGCWALKRFLETGPCTGRRIKEPGKGESHETRVQAGVVASDGGGVG